MHAMILLTAALLPGADGDALLEPWASRSHPQDVARRHVQEIGAATETYRVTQGGTMDGTNCRAPIGGGFAVWDQTWESNRGVRLENVGENDLINPWLSNGRNDFRSVQEIVAGALRPGMSDREKAIALWRVQTGYCRMSWLGNPQAAGCFLTPSTKTVPLTTSDKSVEPFNARHFFDADSISL